jgi:hypothetical protein
MAKVVCRLLPPGLTEDEFHEFVGKDIMSTVKWIMFRPSDVNDVNPIGYLLFDTTKVADMCVSNLNGKPVGNTKYKAVVCIAPSQRVPQHENPGCQSVSIGAIEEDSKFIQFLATMKRRAPLPPAVNEEKPRDFKTPLVEYVEALLGNRKHCMGSKHSLPRPRRGKPIRLNRLV